MRANCYTTQITILPGISTSSVFRKVKKETDFVPIFKSHKSNSVKYSKSVTFENTALVPFDLYGLQLLVKNPEIKGEEEFKIRCLVDDKKRIVRTVYLHSPVGHTRIELDEKGKPHEIMFHTSGESFNNPFGARAKITRLGFLSDIEVVEVKNNEVSPKTKWVPLEEARTIGEPKACNVAHIMESHLDAFNSIYSRGKVPLDITRQMH